MNTSANYSPWDLLPAPEPRTVSPPYGYFYDNVVKHLVKDTVRIMHNGLPIDLDRVEALEAELTAILTEVRTTLDNNAYIKQFQQQQHHRLVDEYIAAAKAKLKPASAFLKPFKHTDMTHRSYFMYIYAKEQQLSQPTACLPTGIPKWDARTVKKLSATRPLLRKLLAGELSQTHPTVKRAMQLLAEHKAELYNRKYHDQINAPNLDLPKFNPNSSTQKTALFTMLGLESEATTGAGNPSWDRDNIERVNKTTTDPILKELTQALIDHSFGGIVQSTFIPAFYRYSHEGRLYGEYTLFGAKTFRYTSKNPNMLNMPSTKSRYSKPIKECFVAPKDFVVYAIDLSALEDRVMASLSRDENKCRLFIDKLDGHCLNAYGYFTDEVAEHMPLSGDVTTDVKQFHKLVESGHSALAAIRQKSKPATFGLNYGAYPKKVAASLKISVEAATAIFENYHNKLYSGITKYREDYVLPTAQKHGRIHMGLGAYLKTDDPNADIRTLNNSTCQFWSIVTLLAINKVHQWIDANHYENDIICTSTIYDSIYYIVRKDAHIIKALNDFIVPVLTKDFMENQTIHNEAVGEIGPNWAKLTQVPNNASLEQIQQLLKDI